MCKRLGFSKCSKCRLSQGVQDAAAACSYYIFLCCFLRTREPQALVDTLERSECYGIRVTGGRCFNTNTKNKLAPCGMPSFPEGNVMHEKKFTGFKPWTLQKLGWHTTQVMPDLKASMADLTLPSVSVVAVVSERQGDNHFSLNQKPIAQPNRARIRNRAIGKKGFS